MGGSFPIRALKGVLAAFGVLLALPYACAPIYQFPQPAPFAGARLFNPYEHAAGKWQRANLHALVDSLEYALEKDTPVTPAASHTGVQ